MFLLSFVLTFVLFSPLANAGDITLNADKSVEYHQKEQKLVATGNAIATKDDLKIQAETLIGYYNAKVKNKINRIEAHQNVHMTSPQAQAFGENLVYDIKTDNIILTGHPAKIITPDATITAQGEIVYYQTSQKATASDNVTVIDNKNNKVFSDFMTAYFTRNDKNKIILDKIEINQNIKIVTPDATITANNGTYYSIENKINLFDNVVITQNGNILKGDKAETNLNTGISKILSNKKTGRVSGIFKEKKKKE